MCTSSFRRDRQQQNLVRRETPGLSPSLSLSQPPLHLNQIPDTHTVVYLTDGTAHGDDRATNDLRGADTVLLAPEDGTRTWKALLPVTVVRSNARTAVAVESTRMID